MATEHGWRNDHPWCFNRKLRPNHRISRNVVVFYRTGGRYLWRLLMVSRWSPPVVILEPAWCLAHPVTSELICSGWRIPLTQNPRHYVTAQGLLRICLVVPRLERNVAANIGVWTGDDPTTHHPYHWFLFITDYRNSDLRMSPVISFWGYKGASGNVETKPRCYRYWQPWTFILLSCWSLVQWRRVCTLTIRMKVCSSW